MNQDALRRLQRQAERRIDARLIDGLGPAWAPPFDIGKVVTGTYERPDGSLGFVYGFRRSSHIGLELIYITA